MEISTIIGIVVGFGGILTGYLMDKGVLSALWMLSAFITVVGRLVRRAVCVLPAKPGF